MHRVFPSPSPICAALRLCARQGAACREDVLALQPLVEAQQACLDRVPVGVTPGTPERTDGAEAVPAAAPRP